MEKQSNKKLKKISKELFKASKMHKGQAERIKKLLKKGGYNKLYQAGGTMYSNTIPTTLTTTNLVSEESNPDVLKAKQQQFEEEERSLTDLSLGATDKIAEDEAVADEAVELAGANVESQFTTGETALTSLAKINKLTKPKTKIESPAKKFNPIAAYRGTRAANFASQATAGNAPGMNLITNTKAAAKAFRNLPKGAQIMSSAETGKTIVVDAGGNIIKQGSAIGAGLKNFATSGAGIGTIASLAGMGISRAADDKDATTMTFGEGTGKVLSGIGTGLGAAALTGAALGSAVPLVGNLIGGAAGAIYGLTKGLLARKKARKEERQLQKERDKYVSSTNKQIGTRFGSQLSNVRAGQLKQKTISGYDLGRNVSVKTGGMRLGIPRY